MRILTFIAAVLATAAQCYAQSSDQIGQTGSLTLVTTCTTTLKRPQPSALICGVGGSLGNSDPIELPFEAVPTAGASAFEVCRNACFDKSNPRCLSFSFTKSDQACSLFGKALRDQGFQPSSEDKNTLYYAKACFHSNCQTVPPTPPAVTVTVTPSAVTVTITPSAATVTVTSSASAVTVTSTTTISAAPTGDVFDFSFGYDSLSVAGGSVTPNTTFEQTSIAVEGTWIWNLQFGANGGVAVYDTDVYTIAPNTEYYANAYCYSYANTACSLTMYAYNETNGILATGSPQACGFEEFQYIFVSFNSSSSTGTSIKYVFRCDPGQGPNGVGPEIGIDAVSLRPAA